MLHRFFTDEQGATAVEYALVASLVTLVALGGFQFVGTSVTNMFNSNESQILQAMD
ncbi:MULTISPECIES: Flp family type IVb pilin [unclassified Roseitalea]|uniref:Flp family type IVb pilin n=1 Tax=unclassified Roseitalea TaxID=2639107 RepID=UPI00273ED599|nr:MULTISPECIES: Flp family type IVb pilin [unclassified Roseitalea]